jgi:hypothetical protein
VTFDPGAAAELFARPLPPSADPPSRPRRPGAVAAAAVVLALFAVAELVSSAGFFLAGGATETGGLPLVGPLRALLDHIVPISIGRACLDLLALFAASAVWRGRPWGRGVGVVLSAWWSVAILAFSIAFPFALPEKMVASLPSAFVGIWRGAAIVNGVFWAALVATPGVLLTRRSSASWFAPTGR